jgi:hypothetical protein
VIKVQGHSNLVRDETNNAILNTSDSEYSSYIKRRAMFEDIREMKEKYSKLESDISDIKMLITKLYDRV